MPTKAVARMPTDSDTRPPKGEKTTIAIIMPMMVRPVVPASTLRTCSKKIGSWKRSAYMARFCNPMTALDAANVGRRNSLRSRTGSATRRSHQTNTVSNPAAPNAAPRAVEPEV